MNTKLLLLPLSVLLLVVASSSSATLVTFDDMTSTILSNGIPYALLYPAITDGYQGLNWANFYILNAPLFAKEFETNGAYYGMATASNVAFNGGGSLAEVDSFGTDFNFMSTYLTGDWSSNLSIQVQGFNGTNLLYDTTVVAYATNPTLFTFNYVDIDRLTFNSFGGQNAGFTNGSGEQFAMDNFTFELVPEPSSLLLAASAALLLWPFLKRKRVTQSTSS